MAVNSSIEWTETTWNPVTGCTKVSAGCRNCYAERMATRLKAMGSPNYRNGFKLTLHPQTLDMPFRWRKPRIVFVNSMSDLFHEDVPLSFIKEVFEVMSQAHWHTFQVLTKRGDRLSEVGPTLDWPSNVWMGVSVETPEHASRIGQLRQVPAKTKFLSLEPLLAHFPRPNLDGIDWVIVGGESGPGARPMSKHWVRQIRDRCRQESVPFFFKQWGGVNKKRAGRLLDGKTWEEMPSRRPHQLAIV